MILAANNLFENICGYTIMGTIILLILCMAVMLLASMVCPFLGLIQEIKEHPLFNKKKRDDEVLDAEVIDDRQLRGGFIRHGHKVQQICNNPDQYLVRSNK